jgi:hypothetical protein
MKLIVPEYEYTEEASSLSLQLTDISPMQSCAASAD